MIKLSIVVPVYNTEKYLEQCLNSLVNQTLKDIEIIIVNDGSLDNSQDIIDKYDKKYSFIKTIKKENSGIGDARNQGIKLATGEYVGFVDSDDWIELDMFEKMYNKTIEEKADIVTCSMNYFIKPFFIKIKDNKIKNKKDDFVYAFHNAWNKIYKKEMFDDLEFPVGLIDEDLAVIPYLFYKSKKNVQLDEQLYNYRFNTKSIMITNMKYFTEKSLDIFKVGDNLKKLFNNKCKEEVAGLMLLHMTIEIMYLPFASNITRKNKKELYSLFHNYFDIEFPNWEENKYYKEQTVFLWFHKVCIKLSEILYSSNNNYKFKTKEEVINKMRDIIKKN